MAITKAIILSSIIALISRCRNNNTTPINEVSYEEWQGISSLVILI